MRAVDGDAIAGVSMAHHAGAGIVPEHALKATCRVVGAVGDDDHSAVLRIAHADAAAVVQRHPGRTAAVLSNALSNGQSETTSLPSIMLSVSRLGEATEPLSRWSRPMTIGALTSPFRTISLNAEAKFVALP